MLGGRNLKLASQLRQFSARFFDTTLIINSAVLSRCFRIQRAVAWARPPKGGFRGSRALAEKSLGGCGSRVNRVDERSGDRCSGDRDPRRRQFFADVIGVHDGLPGDSFGLIDQAGRILR